MKNLIKTTEKKICIESHIVDLNGLVKLNVTTTRDYALNFITVFKCEVTELNGLVLITPKHRL